MSKRGEIENLTRIIRPHIGVITNIGGLILKILKIFQVSPKLRRVDR